MKKLVILTSLLAVLLAVLTVYVWVHPLRAQAPITRPTPDREAIDAARPWAYRPSADTRPEPREMRSLASSRPAAPASALAAWSKIVYQDYVGNWDVFIMNGDGSNPTRLTSSGGAELTPRLNRGATRIVYVSTEPGNYEIYAMNGNGSGRVRLTNNAANDYNPAWSPDGTRIVFNSYRDGQSEVYVMNADGSGPTRLTFSPDYDGEAVWAPDGSQIAFMSIREMGQQIYTMKPDGSNVTRITAVNAAEFPCWSPDGSQLAFSADVDGDSWLELMTVHADGSGLRALADAGANADLWAHSWSPDGRFIANTLIGFINYQGNWYWTNAYLTGFDLATNQLVMLGASDVAWYPDWQSTDLLPPSASMSALPAQSPSPIIVRWSGTDAGPSGILGYDVQVKDGGGTWTSWLTRTTATSANYPGIGGHTYSFRVRAIDNSNNVQIWPTTPQASTMVESLPPVSAINPLPSYQRGDLSVSWNGSDPGGSGIKSYDVQVRDGITGTWTDWVTNTSATTAIFTGTSGHTYSFHVRAADQAQNLGSWSNAFGSVTFYAWLLAGQVRDTRGYQVVDAQIVLSPTVLNTITSTATGYLGYGTFTGEKTLEVAQPGYGMLPPMILSVNADRKLDQFLKPADDVIVNGNFEMDLSSSNWLADGLQSPILTTTIKHTGQQAALLGRPFGWTAPVNTKEPGNDVQSFDMASDPQGNLHIVWKAGGYGSNVVYTTRSKLGSWSTPVVIATNANWEWQGPAIAADALGHVYAAWGSLVYATRDPDGTWSAPESIADSCCYGPQLLVDQQNTLHAMWDDFYSIYYASKPLGQGWSAPVSVGPGVDARFKMGLDGSLHAVWSQGGVVYATKPAGAAWSPPIWLSDTIEGIPDIAVDGQNLPHVVWMGSGNNVMYTHKTFSGLWSSAVSIATSAQPLWRNPAIAMVGPATVGVAYFDNGTLKLTESTDDLPWQEPQTIGAAWGGTAQIEMDDQGLPQLAWQTETNIVQSGPAPVPLTGDSWLTQTMSVPNDLRQPTLSFLYRLSGATLNGTWLEVNLDSETTTLSVTLASNTTDWAQKWIDMKPWAGQPITLSFRLHQTMNLPGAWAYIDDVSLGSWLTPDPQTVTPKQVEASSSTVITITGDNFIAPVQVRLNDTPLPDATWINTNTITATVPVLPIGHYDVIVTNPGGQASGLARALLVGHEVYLPLIHK